MEEAYLLAQRAMADLKGAVYAALVASGGTGLTNAEIGRALGIYAGHDGHQGHIPRTILALMQQDGTVEQDPASKRWRVRPLPNAA